MPTMATVKYGITFARITSKIRTGVTKSDSKVPRSHSRAMTIAVRNTPLMVSTSMRMPGTKNQLLVFASLNQTRGTTLACPSPARAAP